jgi:hypothetical protein
MTVDRIFRQVLQIYRLDLVLSGANDITFPSGPVFECFQGVSSSTAQALKA